MYIASHNKTGYIVEFAMLISDMLRDIIFIVGQCMNKQQL